MNDVIQTLFRISMPNDVAKKTFNQDEQFYESIDDNEVYGFPQIEHLLRVLCCQIHEKHFTGLQWPKRSPYAKGNERCLI